MNTPDLLETLNLSHVSVPGHLRPGGVPGWLERKRLVKSATAAIETAKVPHVESGPRYGLVHGKLSDSAPRNLFEAPNWSWDSIKLGDRLYSLSSVRGASPPQQLVEIFAARPERARAMRLGTGSLYYLPGGPVRLADVMPDGRLSLWADDTIKDLQERWKQQFGDWAMAGLRVNRVDADLELQKQWYIHDDKRPGHPGRLTQDWLEAQRADGRWDAFASSWFPDLEEGDWRTFGTWQSHDPRYIRWQAVADLRTVEYYRALESTLKEFWPTCRFGSSNQQWYAYPTFGRGRRVPWGCGEAWDYSSGKVYGQGELPEAESAVAASTRGLVLWLQDNPQSKATWNLAGQANTLRHAILLCGDLAPVLSVERGVPSTTPADEQGRTVLKTFSDLLAECDKHSGGILGRPQVPVPRQPGQEWRQTTIDCGTRLVRWVSYTSFYAPPECLADGYRLVNVCRNGAWLVK